MTWKHWRPSQCPNAMSLVTMSRSVLCHARVILRHLSVSFCTIHLHWFSVDSQRWSNWQYRRIWGRLQFDFWTHSSHGSGCRNLRADPGLSTPNQFSLNLQPQREHGHLRRQVWLEHEYLFRLLQTREQHMDLVCGNALAQVRARVTSNKRWWVHDPRRWVTIWKIWGFIWNPCNKNLHENRMCNQWDNWGASGPEPLLKTSWSLTRLITKLAGQTYKSPFLQL